MTALRAPAGRTEFEALGGVAVVLTEDPGRLDEACAEVRGQVGLIEAACSRFRDDSELAAVNASAGTETVVGELFARAVDAALRGAELSDGDVDFTCGASLDAVGYDRDFEELRAAGVTVVLEGYVPAPGWRAVSWDRSRRALRIPAGSRLDFGATAKALAADIAAQRAHAAVGCGVLVSLSGDLAMAGPAPEGGWRVRVADDHRAADDAPGQTITLAGGGLATSSTTVRRWKAREGELHHVLDPATGCPAESCWRTVSVAAATCLDANIAATASLVRGAAAQSWLEQLRLPARLVRHDGTAITTAGWPDGHEAHEAHEAHDAGRAP
ncbi:MAG TPA: FAD:protein FMN transferase [Actinocrinis sp.]